MKDTPYDQDTMPVPRKNTKHKTLATLSITSGLVSLSTGVGLVLHAFKCDNYGGILSLMGTGIWCSVFFFFFGLLNMVIRRGRNKCLDILTITISILCFFMAIILMVISGLSIQISNYAYYDWTQDQTHWWRVNTVLLAMQMVVGMGEIVIVSVGWGCRM